MAVFSTTVGRMNVLPDVTTRSFITMFRFVVENRVFVGTYFDTRETEIVGITVPLLKEDARFRVDNLALDLRLEAGKLYFAQRSAVAGRHHRGRRRVADGPRCSVTSPSRWFAIRCSSANGLAFASVRLASDLFLRKPNGALVNVTKSGHVWEGNRCGRDLIVSREVAPETDRHRTAGRRGAANRAAERGAGRCVAGLRARRQDLVLPAAARRNRASGAAIGAAAGRFSGASRSGWRRRLTAGGWRSSPSTSADRSCSGSAPTAARPHEVAETETSCPAGWASADAIWVSRRRRGKIVWTEVDADSGRETGKTAPGSHDCADARPDPASPVDPTCGSSTTRRRSCG